MTALSRVLIVSGLLLLSGVVPGSAEKISESAGPAPKDSLRQAADMCFARHDFTHADSLYRQVLAADTLDAGVRALLAGCVMRLGRYDEALGLFKRALELDPELDLCYLGMVTCYYETGEIERAGVWAARVRDRLKDAERRDWDRLVGTMFPRIAEMEKR